MAAKSSTQMGAVKSFCAIFNNMGAKSFTQMGAFFSDVCQLRSR